MIKINPNLDEMTAEYQRSLADLRGQLIKALNGGRSYEDLAAQMIVGVQTLKNFASGTTKKPSSWTIERLVMALGYRVAYLPQDMPKVDGEIGK